MTKYLPPFFLLLILILNFGCRKDFEAVYSQGDFKLERDTLFLDSVFTNIASRTYHFKIYNTADKDILIDKIYLEKRQQSFYRLNVDGTPGKEFENILIHARDSIFVFVEVTADINLLPDPIYEEKLFIEDKLKKDSLLLAAFIKDADFYYPERFPDGSKDSLTLYTDPQTGETNKIAGFFLPGDTHLTNEKAIVIYGHMAVPSGSTLTIEEGAHLYFHYNSGLIVWENASLKVNGSLGNEVVFEDDRMEPAFENKPGMWNFIWLRENSIDNEIDYAIIKNATVGIEAFPTNNSRPILNIKNTQIYNSSLVGMYAIGAEIKAQNLVLNNFGLNAIRIDLGGAYDFEHCTITNYNTGIRNEKTGAFYARNFYDTADTRYLKDLDRLNISNCIIYGSNSIEYFLEKDPGANFSYQIKNSLIKFKDIQNHFANIPELDFTDSAHYSTILLNEDPVFENPLENKLIIGDTSPCINKGDLFTALQIPLDIRGIDRTQAPDLGAYQHIVFSKK
jgi:hypothetical protein